MVNLDVKKDEIIFSPDDPGELIILESGQLKAVHFTTSGAERLQDMLNQGEYISEDWLFGAKNANTFLIANKDSHVCKLSKNDFHQLLATLPELSYQLLQTTIMHNQQLTQQNIYLSLSKVEELLMAYFTDLVTKQQSETVNLEFELKDLAAYLGTSPETISRTIAKLIKAQKLIKLTNSKYVVKVDL